MEIVDAAAGGVPVLPTRTNLLVLVRCEVVCTALDLEGQSHHPDHYSMGKIKHGCAIPNDSK